MVLVGFTLLAVAGSLCAIERSKDPVPFLSLFFLKDVPLCRLKFPLPMCNCPKRVW